MKRPCDFELPLARHLPACWDVLDHCGRVAELVLICIQVIHEFGLQIGHRSLSGSSIQPDFSRKLRALLPTSSPYSQYLYCIVLACGV